MPVMTDCPIDYAQTYMDWMSHWKNLNQHHQAVEVAVVNLWNNGDIEVMQSLHLTAVQHEEGSLRFDFEATYNDRKITGWVEFDPATKHYADGAISFV